MKSTTNSSKTTAQCPSIPEGLAEWLDALFPEIKTSKDKDIRELDLQSGAREVVDYIRGQYDKQRSS